MALLNLPAGESTITLHIAAADGKPDFNAELHAIELVQPEVREALHKRALAMRSDPTWFQNARYGMMVHWTKQSVPLQGDPKPYEQAVADFDVEKFADDNEVHRCRVRGVHDLPRDALFSRPVEVAR